MPVGVSNEKEELFNMLYSELGKIREKQDALSEKISDVNQKLTKLEIYTTNNHQRITESTEETEKKIKEIAQTVEEIKAYKKIITAIATGVSVVLGLILQFFDIKNLFS